MCTQSTVVNVGRSTGRLVDSYDGVQCCGGHVVSGDLVCCGDDITGQSYERDRAKSCCGQQHVDVLTTHCCNDSHGRAQVSTTTVSK